MTRIVFVLGLSLFGDLSPVIAATLQATPATWAAIIKDAQGGDTVVMSGAFPTLGIRKRTFTPPIVIDASAATFAGSGFNLSDVVGINLIGGNYGPAVAGGTAINMRRVNGVTVTKASIRNLDYGIAVSESSDVAIQRNRLYGIRIDGIRYFSSRKGTITDNIVMDSALTPGMKNHPDAIQLASDLQITSDVVITGNLITGQGQGITMFDGKTKWGYDRITVTNNEITVTYPQALAMYRCRDCVGRGNKITTPPTARNFAAFNSPNSPGLSAKDNTFRDKR